MQDASILYNTLRSNTFIIGLDLGYNTIGDDGAKLLGQLLQVCMAGSVGGPLKYAAMNINDISGPA